VSYVTAASFQAEVLEASQPVLVKFTARWCSQCQLMKPVVDAVATDRAADVRVVMLDVERDEELARQLGVDALPTFMVYRGGEVVATQVGAYGREGLERLLGEAGL
jgi:thioredoxin 1